MEDFDKAVHNDGIVHFV